jgi:hypothetical protein
MENTLSLFSYDNVAHLTKYTRADIPARDLTWASAEEYAISRIWRAKDTFNLTCRVLAMPYFKMEHKFLVNRARNNQVSA